MYEADRYFIANGKKFSNFWRAYEELQGTEHGIEPWFENNIFRNLKGLKVDLDRDYESEALKDIFQKFKNINLLYSGGRDSHTILRKSEKLGLEFKKIITFGRSLENSKIDNEFNNKQIQEYFKSYKNYFFIPNTIEKMEEIFFDNEWMYRNNGSLNMNPEEHLDYQDCYDPEELYITGKDKPQLFFSKGEWYAYYDDITGLDTWGNKNSMFFYINGMYPEMYISACRKLKLWYIKKFGNPKEDSMITLAQYKQENVNINEFNNAIDREQCLNPTSEYNQTKNVVSLNYKNIGMMHELTMNGKRNIVDKFLDDCYGLYRKHKQIKWTYPPFSPMGSVCWVINIDTLESFHGREFHDLTKNIKSKKTNYQSVNFC